jgi:opacity protein-like surface antigen
MRKTVFALALLFPTAANAMDVRPYIGLELSRLSGTLHYSSDKQFIEDSHGAYAINVGMKFNQYFSAEVFYKQTTYENKKVVGFSDIDASYSGYGVTAIGYIPVIERINVEPSFGLGMYKDRLSGCILGLGCETFREESLGISFGLGVGFEITDNVGFRTGYRYTSFSDDDFFIKDASEFYVGIRYMF